MPKKHKRSALEKLEKHWQRASPEERAAFLAGVYGKAGGRDGVGASDALRTVPDPGEEMIANGRYLLPLTVARIEKIMIARRIGPSEVMAEIGFAGQGTALARALIRKASIRLLVISALQRWLHLNEAGEIAEPAGTVLKPSDPRADQQEDALPGCAAHS